VSVYPDVVRWVWEGLVAVGFLDLAIAYGRALLAGSPLRSVDDGDVGTIGAAATVMAIVGTFPRPKSATIARMGDVLVFAAAVALVAGLWSQIRGS
jgi:hypothetical protein